MQADAWESLDWISSLFKSLKTDADKDIDIRTTYSIWLKK